jgi:hypothetical protein
VRGARAAAASARRLADRADVHVVFVPILSSDDRDAAVDLTARLHGVARAWWDEGKDLAKAWSAPLGLRSGSPAWDVYLVFGPDATWSDTAPVPAAWWHQLHGAPPDHRAGKALTDDLVRAAEALLPTPR